MFSLVRSNELPKNKSSFAVNTIRENCYSDLKGMHQHSEEKSNQVFERQTTNSRNWNVQRVQALTTNFVSR